MSRRVRDRRDSKPRVEEIERYGSTKAEGVACRLVRGTNPNPEPSSAEPPFEKMEHFPEASLQVQRFHEVEFFFGGACCMS